VIRVLLVPGQDYPFGLGISYQWKLPGAMNENPSEMIKLHEADSKIAHYPMPITRSKEKGILGLRPN